MKRLFSALLLASICFSSTVRSLVTSPPASCKPVTNITQYAVNGVVNFQMLLDNYLSARVVQDVNVLPVNFTAGLYQVVLSPSFNLFSLQGIDERSDTLSLVGALEVEWYIAPLGYKWYDVDGLCNILQYILPQARDATWTPKLVPGNMLNTNDFRDIAQVAPLEIDLYGNAVWRLYGNFELSCSLVLTDFPFDTQLCYLEAQNVAEFGFVYLVQNFIGAVCTAMYVPNSQWQLLGSRTLVKNAELVQIFRVEMIFQRKPLFHMLSLVIPTVLLALSGATMFIIPPDSGEKMGVAFSVLLTFFLIFSTVVGSLPANSEHMPMLYIYILVLFITAVAGAIFAAIILHFAGSIKKSEMERQIEEILDQTGLHRQFKKGRSAKTKTAAKRNTPEDGIDADLVKLNQMERRSSVINAFAPHEHYYQPTAEEEKLLEEKIQKKQLYNLKVTKYAKRANNVALAFYLLSTATSTLFYFSYAVNNRNHLTPSYYNNDQNPKGLTLFNMYNHTYFKALSDIVSCDQCRINATTGIQLAGYSCNPQTA